MPGEILKEEFMDPLGLNVNQLAHSLRVSATRISEIVRGQRTLSPDTALRLSRYFGTTPKFWLNLQCAYDLQIAEDDLQARIVREVQPRDEQSCHSDPQPA